MKRYKKSLQTWSESKKYLVQGGTTISKRPDLYTLGAYPIYLTEAKGAIVKDIDGNKYIDFQSALGAIILGNAYNAVNNAVKRQLAKGTLLSLATPLTINLAKQLCSIIPCAERVRFLKNGSDATSAAVRIARAFTGRTKIASCHFHGWHDWYYIITSMNRGIPQSLKKDIVEFKYNDINSLKNIFGKNKIAAVIMEPVNLEKPNKNFLQQVKKLTKKHGALLIFDEVVTGFRFSLGGAQKYFGVTPDLCCLAKALANGFPLSVVAGKKEIMDSTKDVVTSITYGEETLSLTASIATIHELKNKPVIKHIWKLGEYFQKEYNKLAEKYKVPTKCSGCPPRLELIFLDKNKNEQKAFFLQESAKRGVIFGLHIFMNYSHKKSHVKKALRVCEQIFKLKQRKLEGKPTVQLW